MCTECGKTGCKSSPSHELKPVKSDWRDLEVADIIEAKHSNGYWWVATVESVQGANVTIRYNYDNSNETLDKNSDRLAARGTNFAELRR